uniref:Putative tick defensin n=1 Tax=Rhipicephalus microplus TaxID=6941 RepID=A0A6G5A6N7_RHIMP
MSGPSPVFLLILGITIAMINIASTSTWAIDPYGTCKSPGVRCGPPGFENSCKWNLQIVSWELTISLFVAEPQRCLRTAFGHCFYSQAQC